MCHKLSLRVLHQQHRAFLNLLCDGVRFVNARRFAPTPAPDWQRDAFCRVPTLRVTHHVLLLTVSLSRAAAQPGLRDVVRPVLGLPRAGR